LVGEGQNLVKLCFLPIDDIFCNVVLQDVGDDGIECGLDGFAIASIDKDTFSCW
jgi:hypothetical protein